MKPAYKPTSDPLELIRITPDGMRTRYYAADVEEAIRLIRSMGQDGRRWEIVATTGHVLRIVSNDDASGPDNVI